MTHWVKKDSPFSLAALGDAVGKRPGHWKPSGGHCMATVSPGDMLTSLLDSCYRPQPCFLACNGREPQTTREEACFLFVCRHMACPPQLREDRQMPARSREAEAEQASLFRVVPLGSLSLVEHGEKQKPRTMYSVM